MMARMGAMPVPGPTHITGVLESFGRFTNPFEIPTRTVSPAEKINNSKTLTRARLTGNEGRQIGRAYSFPWGFQASSVVNHCNTKVHFVWVVLVPPSAPDKP